MLPVENLMEKSIDDYREFLDSSRNEALQDLAKQLNGIRVLHVNATPQGGGVAEILRSLVPLQRSLGIDSNWHVLEPDKKLFEITKKMHNALQGGDEALTEEEKKYYIEKNKEIAKNIDAIEKDIILIHDPQPLASIEFLKKKTPSIIRIHIDSTKPNKDTEKFVIPFMQKYNKIVFTLTDFVPKTINKKKLTISPPAIDPLTAKNRYIDSDVCRTILIAAGINPDKPLVTQVSRFDKWKDPIGVIDAYYIAKNEIKDLQLLLMGVMEASDDPEAMEVFRAVEEKVQGDPDIFLIHKPEQLGEVSMGIYVNAIQRSSDVILQKSLREGFGLTVTEAMWKEKPVVAGNVGGIKLQIKNGENGFLVNSPEEAAKRIVELINNKGLAESIGKKAKEIVRKNFLITRLLEDELKIINEIRAK
ncbi:MAG: glycosyltransferase [Candidatus Spechtbacterales bacterium]|nr:glycosyltransferase [Candidatus Spechtbacterales bacterium]